MGRWWMTTFVAVSSDLQPLMVSWIRLGKPNRVVRVNWERLLGRQRTSPEELVVHPRGRFGNWNPSGPCPDPPL